jgi:hypothetical protein
MLTRARISQYYETKLSLKLPSTMELLELTMAILVPLQAMYALLKSEPYAVT